MEEVGPGLGHPLENHGGGTLLLDFFPRTREGEVVTTVLPPFCAAPKGTCARRGKLRELQIKHISLKKFCYHLLKINAAYVLSETKSRGGTLQSCTWVSRKRNCVQWSTDFYFCVFLTYCRVAADGHL